eukprot:1747396-Pyramimonas_sp.AAC.1
MPPSPSSSSSSSSSSSLWSDRLRWAMQPSCPTPGGPGTPWTRPSAREVHELPSLALDGRREVGVDHQPVEGHLRAGRRRRRRAAAA